MILRILGKSRTEKHTRPSTWSRQPWGAGPMSFLPHQPEPLGRVQTASRTIALGSARAAHCWAVSVGMCCCCGCCPLLAHLDRGSLGERVSVERWRRLGPWSQRGKVHKSPCPLAAPVLSPSFPASFPGECSWRPEGRRQRAEVGGGEGSCSGAAVDLQGCPFWT